MHVYRDIVKRNDPNILTTVISSHYPDNRIRSTDCLIVIVVEVVKKEGKEKKEEEEEKYIHLERAHSVRAPDTNIPLPSPPSSHFPRSLIR